MRMTLALTIAFVLALAGCLGGKADPVSSASVKATPTAPSATQAATNASANATDAPMPVLLKVGYSGNTGTGACVFTVGQCQFAQPGVEDNHMFDPIKGTPTRLAIQFTYGEQKPGMEFYVGFCSGPDHATMSCGDYQTGPSPYLREFDLKSYPAGTLFGMSVGSLNGAGESGGAIVFADVAFQAEGTFTVIPAS